MRKKRYTLMTLALAGGMILGGTGILSQKISDAKTEKLVTTEKKSGDFTESVDETANLQEENNEKEPLKTKQGIRLPEGAEIKEEKGNRLKILWDNRQITYYMSETEKESDADLTIEEVVGIAIKSIQVYTNQNNIGKNIEISLQKNTPADDDTYLLSEETSDGETNDEVIPAGKNNNGIRCYAVDVEGTAEHKYSLLINSVTGQVFSYADFYDKNGEYHEYEDAQFSELEKKMKPECAAIAGDFVKKYLNLGNVEDSFAFSTGLMITENGSRDTFDIFCKTKDGDTVMVTIDQLEKNVLCFVVNP